MSALSWPRLAMIACVVALAAYFFGLPLLAHAQAPQRGASISAPVVLAAAPVLQTDQPASHPQTGDLSCRSCHSDTDAVIEFPSGEELPVVVDLAEVDASVHGVASDPIVGCTGCHRPAGYQYPHPAVDFPDLRSYEITRAGLCENCHQDPHLTAHPGPESEDPVVCTDCHTSHSVHAGSVWQESATATAPCVACHSEVGVEVVDPAVLTQRIQSGLFVQQRVNNDFCLACHGPPGQTMQFENGDTVSISVDEQALHASVHGDSNSWQALACVDCHESYNYPHTPKKATSAREYTLQQTETCVECHQTQHEGQLTSVHQEALDEGNLEAAVCVDCHGFHDVPVPNEPRTRIAETCRQCHSTIHDEFAMSVHGVALAEGDPDVPTCINCHGVHNINDPTTALFRNQSPELCATCHADEEMMERHEISTDVFNTYVDDFHGTTVTLFQSDDPNHPTNKAVCYDCHGVHAIMDPQDPEAGIKENLLVTCQECHPDATTNFSDAWTGHHQPSLRDNPLMFLVNVFYAIVIPVTVGFLLFLVGTDIYRKLRGR
jgi:predicted CXXCH cytochrome family protein